VAPLAWADHDTARVGWYALLVLPPLRVHLGPRCGWFRIPGSAGVRWSGLQFSHGQVLRARAVLGQTNILLGVILLGALAAAGRGAMKTAGACLALAVFVKPYALILVPWLLLTAGIEGLAAFSVVLAAGVLAPALSYGWSGNIDQMLGWYRTVTDTSAPQLMKEENISFATMWAKWVGPGQGPP
jgi:hypothetical protein